MRILTWHVHGAWSTAFVHGRHEHLVPVDDERGPDGRGRMQTVRWPGQAREVTREEPQDLDVDVVVLQRPHELGHLCADRLGGRDAAGVVSNDLDEPRVGLRRFVDGPGAAREAGRAAREHALGHHALARSHRNWDALLERVA